MAEHKGIVQTVAAQAQAGGHLPLSGASRPALPRVAWLPACAPGQTSRHAPLDNDKRASWHRTSRRASLRCATAWRIRYYSPSRPEDDEGWPQHSRHAPVSGHTMASQAPYCLNTSIRLPRRYTAIRFSPTAQRRSYLIRFRRFYCRACKQAAFSAHRPRCRRKRLFYLWLSFSPVMQYIGHVALDFAAARVNALLRRPCGKRAIRPLSHLLWEKNSRPGGQRMWCTKTGAQVSTGSSACQLCSSPCAAYLAVCQQSEHRLSQLCAAWRSRRQAAGKPLHGRWAHTPVEPQPVQGRLV
jgi:hypothetical protein